MARVGLALYLMLATTAGPWVCCCAAAQVGAMLKPAGWAPATPVEAPCCCHGKPAEAPKPADPRPAPARSCSCQQERQPAVIIASDLDCTAQSDRMPVPFDTADDGLSGSALAGLPVPSQTLLDWAGLPHSGGRDTLRALHILRC
jgi:hypothetical protein